MHKLGSMDSRTKLVTIIVPVYNAEKTLKRCIDSLIAQTYKKIEIILVNDGSNDASLTICESYAKFDKRIVVFDKKNGGVSSARNLGLNNATGDCVMFCDSDDWVEPNWCEEMLRLYNHDTLIMCGYYCHFFNKPVSSVKYKNGVSEVDKKDFFLLKEYGAYNPWNKIFSMKIIKENNLLFSTKLSVGEDELFVWDYLKNIPQNIIVTDLVLNHYTWPESNSLTLNVPDDYYKQCSFLFNEINKDILEQVNCSEKAKQRFWQDCYWQYERSIKRIFQSHRITLREKLSTVNSIIRSEEYCFLVKKVNSSSNVIVRHFCERKNSIGIYLLHKIGKY